LLSAKRGYIDCTNCNRGADLPYTTKTRWSPERDGWEIRLYNPHGDEIARMSWREWQRLPANLPFNSGHEMPKDLLPDDLFLAAVSVNRRRRRAGPPPMPHTTKTRWSAERDGWEIRLYNPHGDEIARMSWREWQLLPANEPFWRENAASLPKDILPDDLFLGAVSAARHRRQAGPPPMGRLRVVDGGRE
jgi:hypothetical protein